LYENTSFDPNTLYIEKVQELFKIYFKYIYYVNYLQAVPP